MLTEKEREVLKWLAIGLSRKEISIELGISHSTCRTHLDSIYTKLDVNNRVEALRAARLADYPEAMDDAIP